MRHKQAAVGDLVLIRFLEGKPASVLIGIILRLKKLSLKYFKIK
jgi:hypothetical protein